MTDDIIERLRNLAPEDDDMLLAVKAMLDAAVECIKEAQPS